MQKNKHPKYQTVLFIDSSTGHKFLCGTTLHPEATQEFEGKTYPVYRASISSSSHPLYSGEAKLVDTEGRIGRFEKRYGSVSSSKNTTPQA
jgi:large subunit ribosomal protein L31